MPLLRSIATPASVESGRGACVRSTDRVGEINATAVRYRGRCDCDKWSRNVLNSGFRRTSILCLLTIGMISGCGDNTTGQSALAPVASSESSTTALAPVASSESSGTVAATDPASSDSVMMSDGSVCRPLPTPTSVSPDQALGTTACTCSYDLFSLEDPPVCYQLLPIRTWTHPGGYMATPGSKLDQIGRAHV